MVLYNLLMAYVADQIKLYITFYYIMGNICLNCIVLFESEKPMLYLKLI